MTGGTEPGVDRPAQESPPEVTGSWPSHQYDSANTGFTPGTTGPRGDVRELWSAPFDHGVYCTPAVVDGRVFVGTYGLREHGGLIRAFDAATGEKRWETATGRIHTSSPAIADGTLYVNAGDISHPYRTVAVDTDDGAVRWTHDFENGGYVRSSPAVVDGVVYTTVATAPDEQGRTDVHVRALDAGTGAERWSVTVEGGEFRYSSPTVADGTVYQHVVREDGSELLALDADTGDTEWLAPACSMTGSAAVADGVLYHATGYDSGLVARDAGTGEKRWETDGWPESRFGPAVVDGTVYATTEYPGSLRAVDAASGEQRWSADIGEARGSPVVDDGVIYVPSWEDKCVYALDAESGRERWRFDLESRPYQPPAVVDGTLFVGDAATTGGLYAVTGG